MKPVQVSTQQPLNTMVNSAPGRFDNKLVQRALCTVMVGKSQDAFAWVEKSLDKFAISEGAESGKSIVIVDDNSMAMLQRYASGGSTLYQRLVDRDVTFVASKTIMKFVRKKYGNNPLPELLRNLRQIPFAHKEKIELKDLLRASVLKSLCSDYAFSHNKQLQRVGVVDADSLIPIQPGTTVSTGRSEIPVSMRFGLQIIATDGCNFTMTPPAYADSEFILTSLKHAPKGLLQPTLFQTISYFSQAHKAFFELGSAKRAEELTGAVIQVADNLQQVPWFAMKAGGEQSLHDLTKSGQLLWIGKGVRNLVSKLQYPADKVCLQHCHDTRRTDVKNCFNSVACANGLYGTQAVVLQFLNDPLARLSMKSLVRDIEKLSSTTDVHFCCGAEAIRARADICRNALDHRHCVQSANSGAFSLVRLLGTADARGDFWCGVLLPVENIDKLLPLFSSPLMDWGFQASKANGWLSVGQEPRTVIALGKEHADILLGNASAFFRLDASWSLQCPQKAPPPQFPTLLDQPITGFKYGAVTGLADELFSFTPLPTQYTLLFNSARGYFFGGNIGLMLSLAENMYLEYIEPGLPDGLLKACIRPVASNTLLAAAMLQGQTLSVLGSVAGYAAVRSVGKMARYLWTRTEHNTPAHNKTDPSAVDRQ